MILGVNTIRRLALKLTIFNRLIISYFLIILLVGLSGTYTIIHLNDLNRLIDSIIMHDSRIIKLAEEALDDLYSLTAAEAKYLISKDPDYYRQFKQTNTDFAKKVIELERMADTDIKLGLLTDIKKTQVRYDVLFDERVLIMTERKELGPNYQAYEIEREQVFRDTDQKLRNFVRVAIEDRDSKLQKSKNVSVQVTDVINISGVVSIILVVLISLINTRSINLPIKQLGEKAKEVAGGKFGEPLKISSPPEIRELSDTFNMMCERLKELDQMKIDYISHLSHELRTPLTVIKEASYMLQEGVFSKVPEKQEELFVLIKSECERLILSVNRILDLSRMEAGKMFFSFQQAELRPIIERNIRKLSPLTRRKNMDVALEIPQGIPLLRVDRERIEEVVENLLSNALKFTPEGGKISISARNNKEKRTVEISVSDNGKGIPEDGLMQVFDKFKRVDDRRGAVRGTGLGLAIARHIINAHGGHIWVRSKVGEGSTFTFSLPVS